MAARITKTALEHQVQTLNRMLEERMGEREHPVMLDHAACYGGYRLESPEGHPWYPTYTTRLKGREMWRAIDGMLTLLDYGAHPELDDGRKVNKWRIVAVTPTHGVEYIEEDIEDESYAETLVSEYRLAYSRR